MNSAAHAPSSALQTLKPDIFDGLPRGHFGAGIIDFPWHWGTYSAKGRGKCAEYDCLHPDHLKTLPVAALFKPDCAVAFWFPQAFPGEAVDVVRALGFAPRTLGAWAKRSSTGRCWQFGVGKIWRSSCEFILIGTRGHPRVRSRCERNLIVEPVREHSRKPDELHGIVERLYAGPYLELFARRHYPGWACWGDQLPNSTADNSESTERPKPKGPATTVTPIGAGCG
jgi:N6-adenosine-specific RNA methylase IME4